MTQTETPATDLRDSIERLETAYEFLISFAGQGVGREGVQSATDQIREYVTDFEASLGDAHEAATAVPEVHEEFDTPAYAEFVDRMEDEVAEARNVLSLLGERDRITSQQVDNMNGMSVFQSVVMKFFFLDELTDHLERPESDDADTDGDTDAADDEFGHA